MKKQSMLLVLASGLLLLAACGKDGTSSKSGSSSGIPEYDPALAANGLYSYVYESGEERTKILGVLEKWAVDNKLTGLTLFGDGGYVMYNEGVEKGTNTYIPGYGFGILSEGRITADLAGESNAAWKRYYHSYEVEDPGSLLYMDDKGSVVGDLIGYVTSSYFDTIMSDTGDSYEWVAGSANVDRPIAVNPDEHGLATTYKFPVKVGADWKYATLSETNASFDGREVALEDYITPYQIYYTKAYGLARSAEKLTGSGSIKGAQAYYEASADGFNEEAWKNIGIKSFVEGGQSYLQFEFNLPCTPFYAMYYLAGGMMAPVPLDFVKSLGGGNLAEGIKTWGRYNPTGSLSPKDTFLSTGPYVVERWDKDQQIVFKKNTHFNDGGRYHIEGVHLNVLSAAKTDTEAGLKEFLANKIHAVGIPSTKLDEYKNDPRTTMTSDSSTFKLNLNTCTQETWNQLFGPNGTIAQTPAGSAWECEPAMANKDFVSGLSFALNRKEFATSIGRTPTPNYFGSSYMSDPESGISYNSTQAHKDAVAALQDGTDGFGYNLEKAKAAFKKASEDLIASGAYEEGDEIELEIAWQEASDEDTFHKPVAKYFEDAFNSCGGGLTLKTKFWVGAVWSDVYYSKMMLGQFDIGFGSVSGNEYDPLNFLEVLKSDNTSGFTLNWGIDTNVVDGTIYYDGKFWSFDALWTAADRGTYVENGANSPLFTANCTAVVRNEDGSMTVFADVKSVKIKKEGSEDEYDAYSEFYAFCLYGTTDADYTDYTELYFYNDGTTDLNYNSDGSLDEESLAVFWCNWEWNEDGTKVEITISAACVDLWLDFFPPATLYTQGIDAYVYQIFMGNESVAFYSTIWSDFIPEFTPAP